MDPVRDAVGLAAHPDNVLRRLHAAVGHDKQRRIKTRALGLDDGAVEQPGDRLAGTAGAETQPGPGGDNGLAGDGAERGPAVTLRDPQPRLVQVPVGDEGQRPMST